MSKGKAGQALERGYFGNIAAAARTTAEGMAVTLAQYFRRPTTVQYPDRTAVPVSESLPERYRGFLEVDMDICTACKACERDCPIDCIAIDIDKVEDTRVMTRFDIDMGKCMYCGICVESCPTDARAPGDKEQTKTIRMTREFEGVTSDFETLTFRFIRPGDYVVPFKPKKGEVSPTKRRGEIARYVRKKAHEYNTVAVKWAYANGGAGAAKGGAAEVVKDEVAIPRAQELEPLVKQASNDLKKLEDLMYDQALAQTDCEACGWPTCREYATAMLTGKDKEFFKCEPGGAQSTRDMNLILQIRVGKKPEEAAHDAAAVVLEHHK